MTVYAGRSNAKEMVGFDARKFMSLTLCSPEYGGFVTSTSNSHEVIRWILIRIRVLISIIKNEYKPGILFFFITL